MTCIICSQGHSFDNRCQPLCSVATLSCRRQGPECAALMTSRIWLQVISALPLPAVLRFNEDRAARRALALQVCAPTPCSAAAVGGSLLLMCPCRLQTNCRLCDWMCVHNHPACHCDSSRAPPVWHGAIGCHATEPCPSRAATQHVCTRMVGIRPSCPVSPCLRPQEVWHSHALHLPRGSFGISCSAC